MLKINFLIKKIIQKKIIINLNQNFKIKKKNNKKIILFNFFNKFIKIIFLLKKLIYIKELESMLLN
jgi:hypothetical protein